ncbi:hypothetical protein BH23CHL8_BH23CHL8_00580 [soil metagenome]
MASHGETISDRQADLLHALRPAHLRVDLRLADPGHVDLLARAAQEVRALGAALELAVHANAAQEDVLAALATHLEATRAEGIQVARVLVYPAADGFSAFVSTTPVELVVLVRRHLEPATGPVVFAGGTDQNFSDINRDRPTDPALSGVCFSVSPTVHAADDWSIVENLPGQSAAVRMARSFSGDRAICVSPVTLATRNGPYPA